MKNSLLKAARAAVDAGREQAAATAEVLARTAGRRAELPLAEVADRPHDATRELHADHVLALAGSVAALGLLEPVVVDCRHRLLAGGHRLAALRFWAAPDRAAALVALYGGTPPGAAVDAARELPPPADAPTRVPVVVVDVDAAKEPAKALALEVAENEHRRDYARAEVLALAKRLRAAGYRDVRGRPQKGQRALGPALEVVLGKSIRTVRRLLAAPREKVPSGAIADALRAARRLQAAARAMRDAVDALPTAGKGRRHLSRAAQGAAYAAGAAIKTAARLEQLLEAAK